MLYIYGRWLRSLAVYPEVCIRICTSVVWLLQRRVLSWKLGGRLLSARGGGVIRVAMCTIRYLCIPWTGISELAWDG